MADQDKSKSDAKRFQKSYFDVLGICCSSEVPLVENILKSLDGVKEFSVIVPTRTVIVVHDNLLVSQIQIVKALNQARLEANVRVSGDTNHQKKWPSPFALASGVLLLLSLFKYVYHPLRWLALGAVALGILPILLKGVASLRNFRLDINILVLIAVVGTIAMKDYVEAGTIVFLFTIAQWLESRASHKANAVMSSLMTMAPQKAVIAETGEEVDVDEVKFNTVLAVKAGEVIPIDGVVVDGICEVDEKALTGESFPVSKQVDSTVWAGTINLNGYISVKTTALAEDCVVAKMAKLVEEAQNSKSKTQRLIDRFARYYTPAVIIISAGLAVLPLALRLENHNQWFHLALVVLVSACPCALILSTPVATFCALSEAATSGLLVKGGEYLETLAKVKAMAFDKTGTITRGEFVVTDFQSLRDDISLDSLLYWVSSIESKSSHPMAAALVDHGRSLSIEPNPESVQDFQNFPGEGIHGRIDGRDIYIGNKKIAIRAGSETVPTIERNTNKGGRTIGYIYSGATPAGIFCLSDACRTGVTEAIRDLKLLGIKTAMLTGDSRDAAMYAQEQIDQAFGAVHAELLPEDKARIVKELKKEGPTAMIGDGLNDAPALATADIGISMGISGSALAMETGNVILMSNDLRKVPKAIQLARKARRKVIENVIIAMSTKVAILALAFAGHPLVWAAVLADVGTCLLVIFNSMLLLRGSRKHGGKCCKSSAAAISHKHGHEKPSHNHKSCCSSQEVEKVCKPKKSCCGSGCQSSHVSMISNRRRARVNESTCNRVQETKSCGHVSCNPINPDIEANVPHNHGHSASGNASCCTAHTHNCKSTTAETTDAAACLGRDLQEAGNGHNSHCLMQASHHHPHSHHGHHNHNDHDHHHHHGAPCHSEDNSQLEEAQKRTKDGNFHGRHHDEAHAEIHSSEGSEGRCVEIHQETGKCCKDLGNAVSATTHGCVSLEKRETGSCCKSYVRECCSKHGHLTTGSGGVLSEVIIEQV